MSFDAGLDTSGTRSVTGEKIQINIEKDKVTFERPSSDEKFTLEASIDKPFFRWNWKQVKLRDSQGEERDLYLKISDLTEKLGISAESIEMVQEPDQLGSMVSARACSKVSKALILEENLIAVGLSEKDAQKLSKGIVENKEKWKKDFEEYRELYKERQGHDPDTLYLSKKDTKLPVSIEMSKDGHILVLLRKHVKDTPYYLNASGSFKKVKTAYDIENDKVLAFSTINLEIGEHGPMREGYIVRNLKTKIARELEYLDKYGGMQSSPLKTHHRINPNGSKVILVTYTSEWAAGDFCDIFELLPEAKERMKAFCDIVKSVDKMHKDDVVHRDIKPANMLLTKDKRGVLTDFGLTRSNLTEEDAIGNYGTIDFWPPEYLTDRYALDPMQGDIWALGCTLYSILTGYPHPYQVLVSEINEYGQIFLLEKRLEVCRYASDIIDEYHKRLEKRNNSALNLVREILILNPERRPTAEEVVEKLQGVDFTYLDIRAEAEDLLLKYKAGIKNILGPPPVDVDA